MSVNKKIERIARFEFLNFQLKRLSLAYMLLYVAMYNVSAYIIWFYLKLAWRSRK